MKSIFSRILRVYRIVRRTHGVYVIPLAVGVLFALIRTLVWLAMTLDYIFVPRLWRTHVHDPIVLVGNPRTGTTFLQRFLSDEGFGSGMELFMMLYPSVLLQRLLRPLLPLLEKISPARFHSTEAHETSLSSVETDDASLLFRFFDGFLLYSFFLSFDEEDLTFAVDPRMRDTSQRDMGWLEALWRRSLIVHRSERNIAKLFSLVASLPQFQQRFPEAKILYMVRDPVEIIPSTMSLVTGVLDRALDFWNKPKDVRDQWLERMYQALLMLLSRFHEHWTTGKIDRDRVFIVRYDEMMRDFEGIMTRMCAFLKHEMTPELKAVIEQRGEKQRSYKSKHRYDLASFGLSEERIRRDCAFFYETFLPPTEATLSVIHESKKNGKDI